MRKNTNKHKIHMIQKEQIILLNVQRKLESVLSKLNESINALQVEDLHIQSLSIMKQQEQNKTSATDISDNVQTFNSTSDISSKHEEEYRDDKDYRDFINQQKIQVDLLMEDFFMDET